MKTKKSGGRIRRRAHSSSNSEDDSDHDDQSMGRQNKTNNSQRMQSQSQNPVSKTMRAELSEDDKKRLVADAVFYVLVQEQKRSIHKKGDILKVCILYWKL